MVDVDSVMIQNIDFAAQGSQEIYENLRVLFTTPAGTVPLDRDFGINMNVLDAPLPLAKGRLIVEYTEKTRRYEPRARVDEVLFESDPNNGTLTPKVVIMIDDEA